MKRLFAIILSLTCTFWASSQTLAPPSRPAPQPGLEELAADGGKWDKAVEQWKKTGQWPRAQLCELLKSKHLKTRCRAIDILEELAQDNFGYDPWIMPERIPEDTYRQWREWARTGIISRHAAKTLTPEEKGTFIEKQVGIILTAGEHAAERAVSALETYPEDSISFLSKYLESHPGLPEKSRGLLLTVQCRLLLAKYRVDNRARLAAQICQGNRDHIILGLEEIRATEERGLLPIVERYLHSSDPLIRETAIDIFISVGEESGLQHVMPLLVREQDPNVLQIAFRRSIDYATVEMLALYKKYAMDPREDLAVAALESLSEVSPSRITRLTATPRPGVGRSLIKAIFGGSDKQDSKDSGQTITLSQSDLSSLLDRREWRIRHAVLEYIRKIEKACYGDLKTKVIAALSDEDPSVREAALSVCLSLSIVDALPAIGKVALQDPDKLPDVIFATAYFSRPIDQNLQIALKRASVEQVARLFQYADHYDDFFGSSSKRARQAEVIMKLLLENENSGVKSLVIGQLTANLMSSPSNIYHIVDYLKRENIPVAAKLGALSQLDISINYGSAGADFVKRVMPESEVDTSNYGSRYESGTRKGPEVQTHREKELLTHLRSLSRHVLEPDHENLAKPLLLNLIQIGDPETMAFLRQHLHTFDKTFLEAIVDNISARITGPQTIALIEGLTDMDEPGLLTPLSKLAAKMISYLDSGTEAGKKKHVLQYINKRICDPDKGFNFISGLCRTNLDSDTSFTELLKHQFNDPNHPDDLRLAQMLAYWYLSSNISDQDRKAVAQLRHPRGDLIRHLYDKPYFHSKKYAPWLLKLAKSPNIDERRTAALMSIRMKTKAAIVHIGDQTFIAGGNPNTTAKGIAPNRYPEFHQILIDLQQDQDRMTRALASIAQLYNDRPDLAKDGIDDIIAVTSDRHKGNAECELAAALISKCYSYIAPKGKEALAIAKQLAAHQNQLYYIRDYKLQSARKKLTAGLELHPPLAFSGFTAKSAFSQALLAPEQNQLAHTPDPVQIPEGTVNLPVTVIFFEKAGCSECAETRRLLDKLRDNFPRLNIITRQITEKSGLEQNLALCDHFGASHRDRYLTPSLFMRSGYLIRNDLTAERIEQMARQAAGIMIAEGLAEDNWHNQAQNIEDTARLRESIQGVTLGIVLLGGLLDGINPCAFATLIFFLSYLQIARRNPREMLMTGLSFITAVYLTYFAIGLLFHQLIGSIQALSGVKPFIDAAFILLALLAAALSFRDAWKARQGNLDGMTLVLPGKLKEKIRSVTRAQAKSSRFIIAAFAAGVAISFLELACTGQVYAPIIYQIREGSYSAIAMLALYNLAFVAPLILIFILTYKGLKTQSLIQFQKRHTFAVKLGMGLLFLVLALVIFLSSRL